MNIDMAIHTLREKSSEANELHRLRDRIQELEQLLGIVAEDAVDRFIFMNLSPTERRILNILFTWKRVQREKLYTLLYGERLECDQPEIKVIDVWLSKLRSKLAPYGIIFETEFNAGWFMTQPNKDKLAALADQLNNGHRCP